MEPTESRSYPKWILAALIVLGILVGVVYWLRIPPQMGASDEAFHTVDALYTAVRNHDQPRVAAEETRLQTLAENGKLTAPAHSYLKGVILTAKQGEWQSAAESLYTFMLAQRRDGFEGHSKPTPPTKRKK